MYYRLSPRGWFIWQRLDGEHTARDLTLDYLIEFRSFDAATILALIDGLARAEFIEGVIPLPDAAGHGRRTWRHRAIRRARGLLEWYAPLHGVDPVFTRLYRRGVWLLFTPPAQVAFVLARDRAHAALAGTHAGGSLLALLPAYALAVLLHEAGHAFATKAFGREVNAVGVGWYWFSPIAYVDTSDMWLAGRWPRIAVSLAGVYTNLILAGLAALGSWASPGLVPAVLLWQFALGSYVLVLLNLNPLLELDGYFVLSDALERPNLRPRALAWLGGRFVPALRERGVAGLRGHGLEYSGPRNLALPRFV